MPNNMNDEAQRRWEQTWRENPPEALPWEEGHAAPHFRILRLRKTGSREGDNQVHFFLLALMEKRDAEKGVAG